MANIKKLYVKCKIYFLLIKKIFKFVLKNMKKAEITFNGEIKEVEISENFYNSLIKLEYLEDTIDSRTISDWVYNYLQNFQDIEDKIEVLQPTVLRVLIKIIESNFKTKIDKDKFEFNTTKICEIDSKIAFYLEAMDVFDSSE
jgi:hypothetical protein